MWSTYRILTFSVRSKITKAWEVSKNIKSRKSTFLRVLDHKVRHMKLTTQITKAENKSSSAIQYAFQNNHPWYILIYILHFAVAIFKALKEHFLFVNRRNVSYHRPQSNLSENLTTFLLNFQKKCYLTHKGP